MSKTKTELKLFSSFVDEKHRLHLPETQVEEFLKEHPTYTIKQFQALTHPETPHRASTLVVLFEYTENKQLNE